MDALHALLAVVKVLLSEHVKFTVQPACLVPKNQTHTNVLIVILQNMDSLQTANPAAQEVYISNLPVFLNSVEIFISLVSSKRTLQWMYS